MILHEFRCKNCGRLLFKMEYGIIETKCYRCGAYNIIESYPKKETENNKINRQIDKKIANYKIKNI